MKQTQYSIRINAPKQKVWDTMLEPETYTVWTEPFCVGSRYEGSWEKGSPIRFLAPGGDGMFSEIFDNRKHEFISIKHLGIIRNGREDTESPEASSWAPAFENYTFREQNGVTEVRIDVDIAGQYEEMFNRMWPQALEKLKELCEER